MRNDSEPSVMRTAWNVLVYTRNKCNKLFTFNTPAHMIVFLLTPGSWYVIGSPSTPCQSSGQRNCVSEFFPGTLLQVLGSAHFGTSPLRYLTHFGTDVDTARPKWALQFVVGAELGAVFWFVVQCLTVSTGTAIAFALIAR